MNNLITGLHHLTAIATAPQANIDFYAGLLGLRLIKKTVNFDDPTAYHLYYGDAAGTPGSIVTFFYWPDSRPGRIGPGQSTAINLSVPRSALDYWQRRLERHAVPSERRTRFDEELLRFSDPDGIPVELTAVDADGRAGWSGAGVPPESAVRGMHTAELTVSQTQPTEELLTRVMGYRLVRRDGNRARFETTPTGPGHTIDLIVDAATPRGTGGAGTIHHLAFRVATDDAQIEMQARLGRAGYRVSEVRDRNYFRSIYYREPGGILFEVATDIPGFTVDEPLESLGTALKLPPQFESARGDIAARLPPLRPATTFTSGA